MELTKRKQIIALMKKEIVPAVGCTEPAAVALCTAKAAELLGNAPGKIKVYLSAGVLKNSMGVGIPGTGMTGLPIAVALGALSGKSEYQLEVLQDVCDTDVRNAKKLLDGGVISISLKQNISDNLYIEVICSSDNNSATAIIKGRHSDFVYLERNGRVLLDIRKNTKEISAGTHEIEWLTMSKIYDFVNETPLDEIRFILRAGVMNKVAAEESLKGKFGHCVGCLISGSSEDSFLTAALSYTTAACDARMAGARIPVMTNSGSGNQGISATLPVVVFAETNNNSQQEMIRALTLSCLTVIYIKQKLGRLSALCTSVVSSIGSCCGIIYLKGGDYSQVCYGIKNTIANLTGMICDGAKPGCSMKLASGVYVAVLSALLAMEQKCTAATEGIIDEDVEQSIRNLVSIGTRGMHETDKLILDIMSNKEITSRK